jgi:protein BCP1
MSIRKQTTANDEGDEDDTTTTTIDVDFDFFDPNPQTDYHALLRLLRQLFLPNPSNADPEIDLHGLAELVLAQPLVGTTIKTDGRESDPLAVLTVLNLSVHQVRPLPLPFLHRLMNK